MNEVYGRFHFVTGSFEHGGGWWFETVDGDVYDIREFSEEVPTPPAEILVRATIHGDGETLLGWEV